MQIAPKKSHPYAQHHNVVSMKIEEDGYINILIIISIIFVG